MLFLSEIRDQISDLRFLQFELIGYDVEEQRHPNM